MLIYIEQGISLTYWLQFPSDDYWQFAGLGQCYAIYLELYLKVCVTYAGQQHVRGIVSISITYIEYWLHKTKCIILAATKQL